MTIWLRSPLLMFGAALVLNTGETAGAGHSATPALPATAPAAPCGPVHLFMLPWLRAKDTATASKAGKELRDALGDKFDSKDWCVIPKERTDAYLKASMFSTSAVLTDLDALQLAGPVRADVFTQAEYKDFQYTGTLYYVGDDHAWMRERIPATVVAKSTSQAASLFAAKVKDILKAYEPTKRCLSLALREQKFAEADAAAQQAIAAYPDGVIGRYCLALAMQGEKRPADDVLKAVNDVLARDADNPRALILAIQTYEAKGDTAAYERVARQFVLIDPTNPIVESIVQRLADWHRTDAALAFIAKSLEGDPENKTLLGLEFRLIYSGGHWKEAAKKGEAIAKLDSASVDSFFVRRIVSAYSNDSQPEKVLAWLKTGMEKFPENVGFSIGYAQKLIELKQTALALDVYKRVIKLFPETPSIRLQIANAYNELGQTDSAFAWLHEASKHATDREKPIISGVSATIGNTVLRTAQGTKAVADFKRVVPFAAFADSVDVGDGAPKFIWAYSAYSISAALAGTLEANPSCEVAKEAASWAAQVAPLINGGGGRFNGQSAGAIMDGLTQVTTYLDGFIRARRCT